MKLRIASRKSPLAMWQAEHVRDVLRAHDPALEIEILGMSTRGDKILDQALSKVGGKDLFVKEIEAALLDGRAEIAVHSLKDMPTELPTGLQIAAYSKREDPRDALVGREPCTLKSLPEGAVVGTSSLRRQAQLLRARPDLKCVPIRGNVGRRLEKMETEGMHATILAAAGLLRLGQGSRVSELLSPAQCLPAVGQGILAVEVRQDDAATHEVVARALDDGASRFMALAERAFLARLEGGCQVPIAGHCTLDGSTASLEGRVAALDGQKMFEARKVTAVLDAPQALGVELAEELLSQGAGQVLREIQEG